MSKGHHVFLKGPAGSVLKRTIQQLMPHRHNFHCLLFSFSRLWEFFWVCLEKLRELLSPCGPWPMGDNESLNFSKQPQTEQNPKTKRRTTKRSPTQQEERERNKTKSKKAPAERQDKAKEQSRSKPEKPRQGRKGPQKNQKSQRSQGKGERHKKHPKESQNKTRRIPAKDRDPRKESKLEILRRPNCQMSPIWTKNIPNGVW